ncbi:hypothetical protein GWI33_003383 [Rhynchophorus ferrugineus]|uniref:Laminin EGF-like domain-containing protein n=1 Tax=Rhynchophorus ferrugineus TaxID=354439 RepID=A0A834IXX7_RHYFE|nr:hypothetical protein GWI33_003383 [Rhynchophorus ferrugineus]
MNIIYVVGLVIFVVTSNCCSASELSEKLRREKDQKAKLPPCRACKIFVDSFKKGLDRTSKFKFEGGDAAWEEEKLGSYATSEVRFVEIHENLCTEVLEGKDQCYSLLDEYDEHLETWWFKKQKEEPDLMKYLCIDTYEVCCPENHFGAGTRKGNGKCHCDRGYAGELCNSCSRGFYESYKDDKKVLCSSCHPSCDGACSKAGSVGCEKCRIGWMEHKEKGCMDINECFSEKSPCKQSEFCVNTEGSFKCLDCHRSCLNCAGDGPDECIECAEGYKKKDNMCVSASEEDRKNYISLSRYITYFGLCACTCIVSQKNIYLAAIVGLFVGIYITLSEYILSTTDGNKNDLGEQLANKLKSAFGPN